MKAEEYVCKWLDEKYGGAKDLGDWLFKDVVQFAEDYHKVCMSEVTIVNNKQLSGEVKERNKLFNALQLVETYLDDGAIGSAKSIIKKTLEGMR